MTSFNLDTRTPEHKAAAEQVVKELKENFGKENVIVSEDWERWVSIEVNGVVAYFSGACAIVNPNTLSMSIFQNGETKKHYLISGDLIDTIYIL